MCFAKEEKKRVSACRACILSSLSHDFHLACLVCVSSDCSTAHKILRCFHEMNMYVRTYTLRSFFSGSIDWFLVCLCAMLSVPGCLNITILSFLSCYLSRYLLLVFAHPMISKNGWWIFNSQHLTCSHGAQHFPKWLFNNSLLCSPSTWLFIV